MGAAGDNPAIDFRRQINDASFGVALDRNQQYTANKHVYTGLTSAFVGTRNSAVVTIKITPFVAAGTTTSAPILLPPTQDAAKSWFVKLQVSSDLKAWDDVAPGQFLGSDTARFFRIQTSEAE